MDNRRGQFFSLYLVLLTLLMVGTVIGFYHIQQKNVGNSLVSPKAVLDIRDDLDAFELQEVELIKSSLASASGTFPEDDFIDSFRSIFIEGFMADEIMTNFILDDLVIREEVSENFQNYLEGGLYTRSLTKRDGENLIFTRVKARKVSLLEAKDKSKVNFPVDFYFEFDQEYIIVSVGGVFEVTKK
jgi:hypothetical protein